MGAYCSKPVTEKVSECGEYSIVNRRIIYGATAMQGWRLSMEDAHSVVPNFDEGSSLFGVYDGHGGKEVATFCAMHLPDIIKTTEAYSQGDVGQAMKDAFMQCDILITEKEAIEEMKKYDENMIPEEEQEPESKEELDNLLEESSMPLKDLLAKYSPAVADASDSQKKGSDLKGEVNLILQLLTSPDAGEDTDSDSESDEEVASSSDELDSTDDNELDSVTDSKDRTETETGVSKKLLPHVSQELAKTESAASSSPNNRQSDRKLDTTANNDLVEKKSHIKSLQSLVHDSIETHSYSETLTLNEPKTQESAADISQKTKSLMDLLTSKPLDNSMPEVKLISPATRKRPHPSSEGNGAHSTPKKENKRDKQGYHSGTTAVVGILRENEFIVANAGDSKCVLSHKGKAVDMSFDHKPTDKAELDRITNAGGHVGADSRVNGGLNLSRAIGDHFYKENFSLSLENQMISAMPDIKSVPINDDQEFIVFACDGIWNSMSSQEVIDFICCKLKNKVGNGIPIQQDLSLICESLCDACLAANTDNDGTGCDNMTCILIFLKGLQN